MTPMSQVASAIALWLLAVPLQAGETSPSPAPVPSPAPAASQHLRASRTRIDLGAFGPTVPGSDAHTQPGPEVPRFATEVEVRGRATDSAALTARLAWWLRDFDGTRGPVTGAGRAPTMAEMREFRPHPADSLDVSALVGWLVGKINDKTKK